MRRCEAAKSWREERALCRAGGSTRNSACRADRASANGHAASQDVSSLLLGRRGR